MKIERKELKLLDGKEVVQVTTEDERWYRVNESYVPSVTWICGYYPKGIAYMKWLAEHGWDEAEAIKNAAAEKGSKVHQAITDIVNGKEVRHDSKYLNHERGVEEELTATEYGCVNDFIEWLKETNPEAIATDYVLYSEKYGYAGTVDLKMKIAGKVWIIDLKTSQDVYPSHELQVSAYKNADKGVDKIAILQIGYRRNKNKHYKFTEIEDQFGLFLNVKDIWAKETAGVSPLQRDYPVSLKWQPDKKAREFQETIKSGLPIKFPKAKRKVVVRKKIAVKK